MLSVVEICPTSQLLSFFLFPHRPFLECRRRTLFVRTVSAAILCLASRHLSFIFSHLGRFNLFLKKQKKPDNHFRLPSFTGLISPLYFSPKSPFEGGGSTQWRRGMFCSVFIIRTNPSHYNFTSRDLNRNGSKYRIPQAKSFARFGLSCRAHLEFNISAAAN